MPLLQNRNFSSQLSLIAISLLICLSFTTTSYAESDDQQWEGFAMWSDDLAKQEKEAAQSIEKKREQQNESHPDTAKKATQVNTKKSQSKNANDIDDAYYSTTEQETDLTIKRIRDAVRAAKLKLQETSGITSKFQKSIPSADYGSNAWKSTAASKITRALVGR